MEIKTRLIKKLNTFLSKHIAPYAQELDTDNIMMRKKFFEFKNEKFFSIYIPKKYGGINISIPEKIEIQELFGARGGAFTFLQVQTGTASWLIQQGSNTDLKYMLLPQIAEGNYSVGNCTYHMKLNHKHKHHLVGKKSAKGYYLCGKLCLTSGFNIFEELVIGFHTDNQEVFAIIPYQNSKDNTLVASNYISTISMASINTVSLTFNEFFIPQERLIAHWPIGKFFQYYRGLPPYAYPLGIAKQALQFVTQSPLLIRSSLQKQHQQFVNLLMQLKQKLLALSMNLTKNTDESDYLFSQIIKVSCDSLNFALLLSGGPGLLSGNPIQRLYRELTIWLIPRAYPEVIEKIHYFTNSKI